MDMTVKQKTGPTAKMFFTEAIRILIESRIPFMVGGGYAMKRHTGIGRPPRDLDVFMTPEDGRRALKHFESLGYRTEVTFPHWLGKIRKGRAYVDIIWSSGNGVANVDPSWFDYAVEGSVLGHTVFLSPPEEMIWSKAFVMERERFDGADVLHLILARGPEMDWSRLMERFRPHRLVLLSHLVLFLFVYPSEAERIPTWVWDTLTGALEAERRASSTAPRVCRGTLLSRSAYLDALARGFRDARLRPEGTMRSKDVVAWTRAGQEETAQ